MQVRLTGLRKRGGTKEWCVIYYYTGGYTFGILSEALYQQIKNFRLVKKISRYKEFSDKKAIQRLDCLDAKLKKTSIKDLGRPTLSELNTFSPQKLSINALRV